MPERRLALYYALMFGSAGFTGPFFAPWLSYLGVDPTFTGVIVALPSIAMVATTVYLGSLADRLPDWRISIIAVDWIILAMFCWLLFRQNILDIMIIWTITGLLVAARIPVLDAATASLTHRRGTDYGRIRAIGSLGFVLALLLGGKAFDEAGFGWFIPALIAGAAVRALASLGLPSLRKTEKRQRSTQPDDLPFTATNLTAPAGNLAISEASLIEPSLKGGLAHPGFLLVLGGSALVNASHAYFSAFGMLSWLEHGFSASMSAWLWCTAVVAEILLMWCFAGVAKRLSARHCMFVAASIGVFRWSLSTLPPNLPLLFLLQSLHAVTFGLMFVATVNFIARRVDESIAAKAQSLSATLATAILSVALLVSGALYERVGIGGYWLMSGLCVLGMMLILASYRTSLADESPLR